MPEVKTYVCERCGHQRSFADHWLIAERKGGAFRVFTWEIGLRQADRREYYCGQACLFTALADHLHRCSFPAKKPQVVSLPAATDAAWSGRAGEEAAVG